MRFWRLLDRCLGRGWPRVTYDGIHPMDGVRVKYADPGERTVLSDPERTGGELHPIEKDRIRSRIPYGGRILILGCGAGRETIGLAATGYRPCGVDSDLPMLRTARGNTPAGTGIYVCADLRDWPFGAGRAGFDGAYLPTLLYNYVLPRAERIRLLARIASCLVPGGAILLDVRYAARPRLLSRRRPADLLRRIARGPDIAEPGDVLRRRVSPASDPSRTCWSHEFAGPEEVRTELLEGGFDPEEIAPGVWAGRTSTSESRPPA